MQQEHIDAGKAIQKRTGKTFYLATRFLPERVRHATHVLYAFFRIADEVVDDADDVDPATQRAQLESLRAQAVGEQAPDDPVLEAFGELRERYGIDDEEINTFIDAMATDIETSRYETYEDLESYMRGSAASVGVMMTAIMEPDAEDVAIPHAVKLGEAFQMTNFLRDVREDIRDRDRIYVPQETLRDHGVDPAQIERLEYSESFAGAMAAELQRTEDLYREASPGSGTYPRTASSRSCWRRFSTPNTTPSSATRGTTCSRGSRRCRRPGSCGVWRRRAGTGTGIGTPKPCSSGSRRCRRPTVTIDTRNTGTACRHDPDRRFIKSHDIVARLS